MTVRRSDEGHVLLEGVCPIEDAEPLLQFLLAEPGAVVDWRACETAHTAVLQVLLVADARPLGPPAGRFLREHLEPALARTGT